MSIILEITQYLLNVDYLRTRVPGYTAPHQIPLVAVFYRHTLQRRERGDRHNYRTPIVQVDLKFTSLGERQPLDAWRNVPISFCLVHKLFRFLYFNDSYRLTLLEQHPLAKQSFSIFRGNLEYFFHLRIC